MSRRKHLLFVDDSDAEREIMGLTLGAAFPGAALRPVADPSAVGQICHDESFDCVILDYNMPELDGLTLARQLRAADAYLPIILVTSVGDEMLVAEALRGGVTDYVAKSRITAEAIRRIIGRSIHASAQARVIDEQRAELENFAYALAHDFKQPIRQIMTFSKMLAEEIGGVETGEVQRHLTFLGHAAGRLDKLVDVMLQYTLLNQPPELADVDLNRMLASVRASLAPLLTERNAQFVTPRRAPIVRGNEALMIQVLQNLVVNGLHYNRSPVPRVEVTARGEADSWVIEIADNGIGIAPEYVAEIFKPLIRLHTAAEYAGSGLGLTLARKAILAQHGAIWCESTPGLGSVFHVRLPAAADRPGTGRKRPALRPRPGAAETAPLARSASPRSGPAPKSGSRSAHGALAWTPANRRDYLRNGLRHGSDQTGREWAAARPIVCVGKYATAAWEERLRGVLDAVLFALETGCKWEWLPPEFPARSTVYRWFARWHCDGALARLNDALYEQERGPAGAKARPAAAVVEARRAGSGPAARPPARRSGATRPPQATGVAPASAPKIGRRGPAAGRGGL
jgi:signal transduction histidine kinase/transposase